MDKWLPKNISTYGGEVDHLFYLIYYITGIVFVLVAACMVWFLIRYRDRGDGRRAIYSHGNNTLEVVWTVIPTVIFLALGFMGASSWASIKMQPPSPDLIVKVEAKQFNWAFTYPGPDGKFGNKDDKRDDTSNTLRVPVNKVIHLELSAKDVIHSFFVPQLRLKQDALPGRTITAWFEATEAGRFEIPCAELCGFGHTTMVGFLKVLDPADPEYVKYAPRWGPEFAAAVANPTPIPEPAPAIDAAATPAESPAAAVTK